MEWNDLFMALFRDSVNRYLSNPGTDVGHFFLPNEVKFLKSIGHQPGEFFAYVRDYAANGVPSPGTLMLIAAVRRSFFLTTMRGINGNAKPVMAHDLPPESEQYHEIPYLPRLIRKAEAKLFGTLVPDVSYGDVKDLEFLRAHGNIHPADFLYIVWNARGDRQRVITAVLNAMEPPGANPNPASEARPQGELRFR